MDHRLAQEDARQRVGTIVHEGHTYRVDQPEVIPIQAAARYLSASDQRFHRLFGINRRLRVRRVEPGEAAEQLTAPQ
jgi:hypothetical protein